MGWQRVEVELFDGRTWLVSSVASALSFIAAGIAAIVALSIKLRAFAEYRSHSTWNGPLDAERLHARWEERHDEGRADLAAVLLAGIAWTSTLPPVLTLATAGARFGSARLIGTFFQLACTVIVVDLVFRAGMVAVVSRLATWDALFQDDGGAEAAAESSGRLLPIQALEIAYRLSSAHDTFIVAIDDLLLSIGLALAAIFCKQSGAMPRGWGAVSVACAACTHAVFWCGIGRHASWHRSGQRAFSGFAALFSAAQYFVLMPVWVLWLGAHLHRVAGSANYGIAEPEPGGDVPSFPCSAGAEMGEQRAIGSRGHAAMAGGPGSMGALARPKNYV
ncbi:hypothetical protein KFE25_010826 [Diacronema lutheri]|uniref:Uncharacterized protein n=1 Tax=Diacronema lutheri TaxID=2081491 RepID=A0A8J5X8K0_DIALT|nr:hypothetical protein KFE25_010826 [Diacronema lutheri]